MPVSAAKNCCACAVSLTDPGGRSAGRGWARCWGQPIRRGRKVTSAARSDRWGGSWCLPASMRRQEFAAGYLAGRRRAGLVQPRFVHPAPGGGRLAAARCQCGGLAVKATRRLRQAWLMARTSPSRPRWAANHSRLLREACEQHHVAVWFCACQRRAALAPRRCAGSGRWPTIFRWRRSTPASIRRAENLLDLLPHLPSCMSTTTALPATPTAASSRCRWQWRMAMQYRSRWAELLHTPDWAKPIVMRAMELNTSD